VSVLFWLLPVYHFHARQHAVRGAGLIRPLYFTILLSHTVLAMLVALWLAPVTLYRAARRASIAINDRPLDPAHLVLRLGNGAHLLHAVSLVCAA
jgi:uncharacterized membrane protein YozB (DUF420 family)